MVLHSQWLATPLIFGPNRLTDQAVHAVTKRGINETWRDYNWDLMKLMLQRIMVPQPPVLLLICSCFMVQLFQWSQIWYKYNWPLPASCSSSIILCFNNFDQTKPITEYGRHGLWHWHMMDVRSALLSKSKHFSPRSLVSLDEKLSSVTTVKVAKMSIKCTCSDTLPA